MKNKTNIGSAPSEKTKVCSVVGFGIFVIA